MDNAKEKGLLTEDASNSRPELIPNSLRLD